MTKKIDFFSKDETGGAKNPTRRISPGGDPAAARPPAPPPPADGGNATRRITPGAAPKAPNQPKPDKSPEARKGLHTRVIGTPKGPGDDEMSGETPPMAGTASEALPTVGWLVVAKGPGRGASVPLGPGVCQIGRDEGQRARVDFGDSAISRTDHAYVAYDNEERKFYMGHGGKSNLVRLNDKPVLNTEEIFDGDKIRIGETTLMFVALCGKDFDWTDDA